MTIARIALLLLLAQNPASQQPAVPSSPVAPASIEGVIAKTATGETLSKVTVTLTETRPAATLAADLQSIPVLPNSPEYALVVASLNSRNAGPAQVVTTTSDGRFLFENLKPGTYSLKATLGGYAPVEYGQRGPNGKGMNITLKGGQKVQGISLTMTPGSTITGHVFDTNGEPLGRALVQAQKLTYQEQGRSLVTVQAVATDDKGEFRLFWLPPGQYYVSAMPTDERSRTLPVIVPSPAGSSPTAVSALTLATALTLAARDGIGVPIPGVAPGTKVTSRTLPNGDVIEEAAMRVFYPTALDMSTATPIEIRPGGVTTGIDISLRMGRVFRIRGVLISATTGKQVAASQISLIQRNGSVSFPADPVPQNPNSNGFEIAGVAPGSYMLLAAGTEGPGQLITSLTPIEVQGNVENVIVTGTPSVAIHAHVSTLGTLPTTATPQMYRIRLEPQVSGLPAAMTLGTNMQVRQDDFIIPISISTDYRVSITPPPNTYVQSIRFGGQDVLRDGLHINGSANETLEVVVSPNAGRLEGEVTSDRQKFPNATVVLMPSSSNRQQTSLYQTVQSNADGHFTFEGIPPGTYKVFAWEDVESFAWLDADFMRNFESRGTETVIREGSKEKIELTVIPR
jgi:protocatechuate 3,4-dioxygenase beta subunit